MTEPPGSYDICPICFWEDDAVQLRFAATGGGANAVSLAAAQQSFAASGATEPRFSGAIRTPTADEGRDPEWRAVEILNDNIETPPSPWQSDESSPDDATRLYYWRTTYWRT